MEEMYMENNHTSKIVGIGSVSLIMKDGSIKLLRNVRYVPKLKINLISLDMLDFIGCVYMVEVEESLK